MWWLDETGRYVAYNVTYNVTVRVLSQGIHCIRSSMEVIKLSLSFREKITRFVAKTYVTLCDIAKDVAESVDEFVDDVRREIEREKRAKSKAYAKPVAKPMSKSGNGGAKA